MAGETFDAGTVVSEAHLDRDPFLQELQQTKRDLRELSQMKATPTVALKRENFTRELNQIYRDLDRLERREFKAKVGLDAEEASSKAEKLKKNLGALGATKVNPEVSVEDRKFRKDVGGIRRALNHLAARKVVVTIVASARNVFNTIRSIRGAIGSLRSLGAISLGFTMNMEAIRAVNKLRKEWLSFSNLVKASHPMIVTVVGAIAGSFGIMGTAVAGAGAALGAWAMAAVPAISRGAEFAEKVREARTELRLATTAAERTDALEELSELFAQMTPTMRKFVRALNILHNSWQTFQSNVQPGILRVLTEAVDMLGRALFLLVPVVNNSSKVIEQWMYNIHESLRGGGLQQFIRWVSIEGVALLRQFGIVFGNVFMGVLNILQAIGPYSLRAGEGFISMSEKFLQWSKHLRSNPEFIAFMEHLLKIMPDLATIVLSLVRAFIQLEQSIAPIMVPLIDFIAQFVENHPTLVKVALSFFLIGGAISSLLKIVMGGLLGIGLLFTVIGQLTTAVFFARTGFEFFSMVLKGDVRGAVLMFRKSLWPLIARITGLTSATTIASAGLEMFGKSAQAQRVRTAAFNAGITRTAQHGRITGKVLRGIARAFMFLKGPVGIAIMVIGLLVAAFVWLWNNCAWFRDFWIATWNAIKTAAVWTWQNALLPVWNAMVAAIRWVGNAAVWLWQNIFVPAWTAISTAVGVAWGILQPIFQGIWTVIKYMGAIILTVIGGTVLGVFNMWWALMTFMWNNVWQPIFRGIGALAIWLWENVLRPVWHQMQAQWNAFATIFMAVYRAIIKPVFDLFAAIARWLWSNVLLPVFTWIGSLFTSTGNAMHTAYQTIIKPVFDFFAMIARWLWFNVLSPIWIIMQMSWQRLLTAMKIVWDTVLHPVFNFIAAVARWLYHNILLPIWLGMQQEWRRMVVAMKWIWDNILHPVWNVIASVANWLYVNILRPIFRRIQVAWDVMGKGFRWIWTNILKPVFNAFGDAVGWLERVFKATVDKIKDVWDTLVKVVGTPISFVVNTFWNNGVVRIWNGIAGLFGLGKMNKVDTSGWPKFAEGGPVEGGIPGKDSVPLVAMPGEYILPKHYVDQMGGPKAVHSAVHGGDRTGGPLVPGRERVRTNPNAPTWQQMVTMLKSMNMPGFQVTSTFRPGDPGFHGKGQAVDFVTSNMAASARRMSEAFPNSLELIHNPGGSIHNGKRVSPGFWGAQTWANHRDHIHWAMGENVSGAGGGGTGLLGWAAIKALEALGSGVEGTVRSMINGVYAGAGDAGIGDMISAFPTGIIDTIIEWIRGNQDKATGGGSQGNWKPTVHRALDIVGLPRHWTDEVLAQIQIESGGDPRAINNWDINAQRGMASRGLLQTIPPTFHAHRHPNLSANIFNPLSNIVAAMRYAISRYGSLGVWPTRAGYARGTRSASAGWHWVGEDGPELMRFRGGEQVLSNSDSMVRELNSGDGGSIAAKLDKLIQTVRESRPVTVTGNTIQQDTLADVAEEFNHQVRVAAKEVR